MTSIGYDTVVIGGGISGLTTAYHLHRGGCHVGLLEACSHIGGATSTFRRDGFLLEHGPFNVIVREPAFVQLLEDLKDHLTVVTASQAAKTRFLYRGGTLHAVPSSLGQWRDSKLLGNAAKCRMMRGLLLSQPARRENETIEQAAKRRFGREATETLVSAVIAGIYAGDISKLCLSDCFPMIGAIDREMRCMPLYALRGQFRKHTKTSKGRKRPWRGLVSLKDGLGSLSQVLADTLGSHVKTGATVKQLLASHGGFTIRYQRNQEPAGASGTIHANRIVLATPAHVTAKLIQAFSPDAAALLDSIYSAPMVVLNLGYHRRQIGHDLNGFGYLVPRTETDYPLLGVLWANSIFPWHAPADHCLLRVFIGGTRMPDVMEYNDDDLLRLAYQGIGDLLQVHGDPMLVNVCRWPHAIPQYVAGHRSRVAEAQERLQSAQPDIYLAGNYIEGVSLNDCIRNGTNVAKAIILAIGSASRQGDHAHHLVPADAAPVCG